jgi:hypothetical protein
MKAADLDDNGTLDLAVAFWGGNSVGIYLNPGDGTLTGPGLYATQRYPFGLDIADFNEDGTPDIATANFGDGDPSTSTVLLGDGDGTFTLLGHVPTHATHQEDVAAGDFNGDGHDDIVVIDGFWYEISVLLGGGDGTFEHWGRQDSGGFPRAIDKADLDADGDLDLVTACLAYDGLAVLTNESPASCAADFDGNGVVNTQDVLAFLNAFTSREHGADFDGNGVVDTQDVLAFLNAWVAGCD